MAFKHYLSPNSYTSISNLVYEKALKRCTVMLEIFADETKTVLLANKGFTVDGQHKCMSLASLKNKAKSVPAELNEDVCHLIDQSAEGEFSGYEGQLTKYNPVSRSWDKWVLWEGLTVYVEDEQKYYKFTEQAWKQIPDMGIDGRVWDKWLAPQVALADGTNPMQQAYKLMKTLPQFKDCEDC